VKVTIENTLDYHKLHFYRCITKNCTFDVWDPSRICYMTFNWKQARIYH